MSKNTKGKNNKFINDLLLKEKNIEHYKVEEFRPEEKYLLLSRVFWKRDECYKYVGYELPILKNEFKNFKKTPFKSYVYRDEILKYLGSDVYKELRHLKNVNQKTDNKEGSNETEKEKIEQTQDVKIMSIKQKRNMLDRNIWRRAEASAYVGLQPSLMKNLYKQMKEFPPFQNFIYRDDLFELLETTKEKEIKFLQYFKSNRIGSKKRK